MKTDTTDTDYTAVSEEDELIEPGCPVCGYGDSVPANGYFRCPACDAEWTGEDDDDDIAKAGAK